jgi:hypothetical protein
MSTRGRRTVRRSLVRSEQGFNGGVTAIDGLQYLKLQGSRQVGWHVPACQLAPVIISRQ